MNLRRATIADIPTLLEVESTTAQSRIYSPILNKNEWKEELRKCVVYLIEEGGKVIGDISYEMKSPTHAYLSGLVIVPQFHGRGIARAAMKQILEELEGINHIDLVTHPDNFAAVKLYESLGFNIETRKENYYGDGEPRLILVLKRR